MNKTCLYCGKFFDSKYAYQKYCCEKCKSKMASEKYKMRKANGIAYISPRKSKKVNQEVIDFTVEARKQHLTYGQLQMRETLAMLKGV